MEAIEQNSQIISRAQQGDLGAFSSLYEEYFKKIYGFIYYRTRHKEVSEDLTSLIFTKALEKLYQYKADKGTFSAWLYRIARNTLYDHWRTSQITEDIDLIGNLSSQDNPAKEAANNIALEQIQSYLNNLSKEQREIVLLRLWDGLSYEEIAGVTGKSLASCKMSFSRTMAKIRQEFPLVLLYLTIIGQFYRN
ncbi:sigma-70 family RNA polymerase sigma factor [Patescibacteria group bacterium]|nr:sigma-70 family RNA polymerase sigma factor [Patescibacteria group bacterium]